MASTAHKDAERIREHFADAATLDAQATELARWISESSHFVAFTGAGVSTSAGIPDFRGPKGVWTMRAQGKRPEFRKDTAEAIPTRTHMALVTLEQRNQLKFLISQNCDGLHRRSGFDVEKLAELHGNSNLDVCKACGREYLRDFHARNRSNHVHDHVTDRNCVCGAPLYDTIINFGEDLPEKPLRDASTHSKSSDLFLVLGSSLTVSPANAMPEKAKKRGAKLVICNLQKTDLDAVADLRIFAKTDDLMDLVMSKLGVSIEPWMLRRRMRIDIRPGRSVTIAGVEKDGIPASIFSKVKFGAATAKTEEPFEFGVSSSTKSMDVQLYFFGHYNEPKLTTKIDCTNAGICLYELTFDPRNGTWMPPKLLKTD